MISDIIRKLNSYLSFLCAKNKRISSSKDKLIKRFIKENIKKYNLIKKNLKNTHNIFNKKLFLLLIGENIKNFLREGFIQKMFFLHNRFFIFSELNYLKRSRNFKFYKKLLKESSIGNPVRYFLYQNSSGNRINHVYHLNVLSTELNLNLNQIKEVYEFGAGYGCMAHIFSKINKDNKYTCFDTHYVNLLQYYYLKHNNLDVGFSEKHKILLTSDLKKINKKTNKYSNCLFIANWSLSETPIKFRENFVPLIKYSKYILISFQEKFENINNLKYFTYLKKKILNNHHIRIIKNKFYKGNLLNRQNHYFFIGKKL